MIKIDFSWLQTVLNTPYQGDNLPIKNINTDSRTLCDNEVFLALKGPNFDGHKFVKKAKAQGAIAAIVEHPIDCDIVQFIVPDTRLALGELGKAMILSVAPKTIAITGSVGKTTVKEMCAAILSKLGNVLATKGNFNNDIGVPLTLFRLESDHQFAVIELGANHIGEIAYTTSLVQPDVAVVCNVAPAHIEGFGSIEGVAQAKGEIFSGLKKKGTALLNCDCKYVDQWREVLTDKNIVEFSMHKKMDVWAEQITLDETGHACFTLCTKTAQSLIILPLPGEHNVTNAVIAASLTLQLGASLEDVVLGLQTMPTVKGRVNLIQVNDNLNVIDDTYNANVKSVKAAIDLLASMSRYTVLVLGDMGELGEHAHLYHQKVGKYANKKGIDALYSYGELSRFSSEIHKQESRHFTDRDLLNKAINELIIKTKKPCAVLVKGSRSARMELIVENLINSGQSVGPDGVLPC